MTWAWASFWVDRFHQTPASILQIVFMKVINAIIPIIPTENINASSIYNCSMSISWRGWLRIGYWQYFCPQAILEVKLEKIIPSIGSIISTKDIKVAVNRH